MEMLNYLARCKTLLILGYATTLQRQLLYLFLHICMAVLVTTYFSDYNFSQPRCPIKNHISSNVVILYLNFSNKLEDELFFRVVTIKISRALNIYSSKMKHTTE